MDFTKFSHKFRLGRPALLHRVITLCMVSMLICTSFDSQASDLDQSGPRVTGYVTDAAGEALIGVNIIEEGTSNGTVTDQLGYFEISTRSDNPVLIFRFLGYRTEEVSVGARTSLEVLMVEDNTVMDGVVVIGYGTTTKKELTGSVASLSSENFISGNVTDPLQLLQGQIAGLSIVRGDGGDPNGEFSMQLRGLTTMSGGASPLIVIDGVVGGDLTSVHPDDIQSIDVLKDGSAAAIYGTRGTNGVILVTTKKATPGYNRIEFSSYIAMQSVAKKPGFMSAEEYRNALDLYGVDSNRFDHGASTDWFDEITRNNPISQNYSLSSSGGTSKLNYRASVSWNKDDGLVKNSSRESLRARMNVNQMLLNDRLKMDYSATYATSKSSYANNYIMRQAMFHNPTEPVWADESTPEQYGPYYYVQGMEYYNPVAMLEQRNDSGLRKQFTGSINASLEIVKGLRANALVSMTETSVRFGHYYGKYNPEYIGKSGQAETFNNHYNYKMLETTLDYSNIFNGHKIQAIVGYSYSDQWSETYNAMNYGFDTDLNSFYNLAAGSAIKDGLATMSSNKESSKLISFFGRVMYNFGEKYLVSASIRYEGSSRFGANHKWGTFPAISAGWRISQEDFMRDVRWVNDLKLRVGYGVTGNQEIGNYQSIPILSKSSSYFFYNGQWISIYQPGRNANPELRWEKKKEVNVGIDASMFDNRFGVIFDWYNRRTKDLLYNYSVPVPPNLYNRTFANVGTIDNRGIEFTFTGTPIVNKNFSWNITATVSRNTNKLVSFSNDIYAMDALDTGYLSDDLKVYTMRVEEGGSIGNFYGPKFLGFDGQGGAIYDDVDGNGIIDEEDYQVIGNAYPDVMLSLHNTFKWKNWDLSFLLRASIGNDVLNQTALYYGNPSYLGTKNILKSTTKYDYTGSAFYSSRYVEDGSYLKLDNITLGYTWNFNSDYISKLRIYVTGQNLFTVTGYSGVDPEVSLSGLQPGIDWYSFYPRTRTFVLGAKITF